MISHSVSTLGRSVALFLLLLVTTACTDLPVSLGGPTLTLEPVPTII